MIGVSNTSTLIVLSKLGYVDFLQRIFERIYIPISVEQEIFKKKDDVKKAVKVLIEQGFIEVKSTENMSIVQVLNVELGIGESQAIALSKEIKPDYVLLDDLKARQYAKSFKININYSLTLYKVVNPTTGLSIQPYLTGYNSINQ